MLGAPFSYAERIRRTVRPNIVFAGPIEGNPIAEIDVHTARDGSIVKVSLVAASGVPQWDSAVQAGIWRTKQIPLDINGKVPPVLRIAFRPKVGP